MNSRHPSRRRFGHTLVELIAALVSGTILLAGLGAVMMIASQVAYSPAASTNELAAAEAINRLADDIRYARLITDHSTNALEFVVADRDGDGAAERIRYESTATPDGRLERTLNGGTPVIVLDDVEACLFALQTSGTPSAASQIDIQLQTGVRSEPGTPLSTQSRVTSAIALVELPEVLSAYWRADLDLGIDPTVIDADHDGNLDWTSVTGELRTNPLSDFSSVTVVEARGRQAPAVAGNGAVLRINVDRQGGTWGSLGVKIQRQLDGSQTLTLFQGAADASLRVVENLTNEPVRFRLTILPATNEVKLHVNDQEIGPIFGQQYFYIPYSPALASQYLSIATDAGAEFDYVEVRAAAEN